MEACPLESTNRSRFSHLGSSGSYRRNSCHRQYVTGARPIGAPGWPLLACCTASIARVRMVLMDSVSSCLPVTTACSLATMRCLLLREDDPKAYWLFFKLPPVVAALKLVY